MLQNNDNIYPIDYSLLELTIPREVQFLELKMRQRGHGNMINPK
jgi:hypothetical protein